MAPEDDASHQPSSAVGPMAIAAFVILVVCTNIAAIVWARLLTSSPELLLALSSRNRYLALTLGADINRVAYWLIGCARLALAFGVCHLAGRAYGEQILKVFTKYLGIEEEAIGRLRSAFDRADWAIVPIFVGSNIVAAISGIQRTTVTRLAFLVTVGLAARLALLQLLARLFANQLDSIIAYVQKYSWWIVGASVLFVALTNMRNTRRQ
jgi:membrane protein DedA with SNARE-associated domain